MQVTHVHATGVIRREFLQVGFSGLLGLGLTELLEGRARAKAHSGAVASSPATSNRTKAPGPIADSCLSDRRPEPPRFA